MEISWEGFQKIGKFPKGETLNGKFREKKKVKWNGNSRYSRYSSQGCPRLWKLRNILFHSTLKISRSWNHFFYRIKSAILREMLSHSLLEIFGRTGSAHFHSSCICVYPQHLRRCVINFTKHVSAISSSVTNVYFATRYLTNSMKYWCWYAVYCLQRHKSYLSTNSHVTCSSSMSATFSNSILCTVHTTYWQQTHWRKTTRINELVEWIKSHKLK